MTVFFHLARFYRTIRTRRGLGLGTVAAMLLVAIVGNALCYYFFEGRDNGIGIGDALWCSIISISTIGYGDFYATSIGARLGTIVFVIGIGLAAFTILLGMIIDWSTDFALKGQFGMGKALTKDHILIVNFPSAERVKHLVNELRADPAHRTRDIVVVSDKIERLPFSEDGMIFIHGSPLHEETYRRAQIEHAVMAIVLSVSYEDTNSDAVVAASISVIEVLRPEIYTIAECREHAHRGLFRSVNCDAIVEGLKIADNLIVQEVHDPGVAQMVDVLTSPTKGATLFSTKVDQSMPESDYQSIVKGLLDQNVNVLAVTRGDETVTVFQGQRPRQGDRMIYVADQRRDWGQLRREAGLA
ncbi:MAG: ion channel [Rubripirellula sp.]